MAAFPASFLQQWNCVAETEIHTLPCIKQITNEQLLYGTGPSTQCSVPTLIGSKSKKDGTYDSLCCTAETNTTSEKQLYSNKN